MTRVKKKVSKTEESVLNIIDSLNDYSKMYANWYLKRYKHCFIKITKGKKGQYYISVHDKDKILKQELFYTSKN